MRKLLKLTFFTLISASFLLGGALPLLAQVTYKQNRLMFKDPAGDKALLSLFWDTCVTGVEKCIKRENVAPQESQLRASRFASENPILPDSAVRKRITENKRAVRLYDLDKTFENFKKIIREENSKGLSLSFGKMHGWADSRLNLMPKMLLALGTATSARFMYVGKEVALIRWIRKQEDNSVTLEALFRKSYVLNRGNAYLTILTIENVLSDATFEELRENTAVNQKLKNMYFHSPNKFGDWYHFFGTMLAGYAGLPAGSIAEMYGVYRGISRGDDAEKSTLDADKAGAELGAKMHDFVRANTPREKTIIDRLKESLKTSVKSLPKGLSF